MSHQAQKDFFTLVFDVFPEECAGNVIDIGSLDINGGPHNLIQPSHYVGVDISEGENVSLVGRGEDVELPSGSFDFAMSSECFEHNANWAATFFNMIRMVKPGGVIAFSAASIGRWEHGTLLSDGGYSAPFVAGTEGEHYRNLDPKLVDVLAKLAALDDYILQRNRISNDIYFVGLKSGASEDATGRLANLKKLLAETFDTRVIPNPLSSWHSGLARSHGLMRIFDKVERLTVKLSSLGSVHRRSAMSRTDH